MDDIKFKKLIADYIASKAGSWSASTLKSERSRLSGVTFDLLFKPEELFKFFKDEKGMKPYAVKTAFVRAGELLEFAMDTKVVAHKENVLKKFMADRAQLFKNAYTSKPVGITFEEAVEKIKLIEDEESKAKAIQLLFAGMRWAESLTLKDGQVITKGGATRNVALANGMKDPKFDKHYTTFRYHLKKVGLKPHDLRKLCATKAAEMGAGIADLMALFGWTNSNTAMKYVQAQKEKEFANKMAQLMPKENEDGKQVSKQVSKAGSKDTSSKGEPDGR